MTAVGGRFAVRVMVTDVWDQVFLAVEPTLTVAELKRQALLQALKRSAVRPIVDGLRHRFHVSVAEVDHQDTWQRAAIGVAVVAESSRHLETVLDSVERFVAAAPDVELLDHDTTYLDPDS